MGEPPTPTRLSQQEAIAALWASGQLAYKLFDVQKQMRAAIAGSRERVFVVECARRLGKSFLACLIAIEHALQLPKSQIRFAAPDGKALRKIINPLFAQILSDCPKHLRPEYNTQDGSWKFKNGSEIHLAGVNNGNADSLRGAATHLAIVDEAGFVDELEYLVQSVLVPMLLTTDGRVILISTPPRSPAHEFVAYAARAAQLDSHFKRTIHHANHISSDTLKEFCREAGGEDSVAWRREYLCEHIADETLSVLPEFSRVEKEIVGPHPRPSHFKPVVVADVGFKDYTAVLFGYHDFRQAVDVIEAEYVTHKSIASDISVEVDRIATKLWGELPAMHAPRYADAPLIVLAELGSSWVGVAKTRTDGNFKEAAVNDVRTRLASQRIRINPACEQLCNHARYAVWNKQHTDFQRMQGYGHFDAVDALTYFVRQVDRSNPYGPDYLNTQDMWIEPQRNRERENLRGLSAGPRWNRTKS
ncbi:terminase large subunit domain-containing protein [Sandaracinus amylolyticus]|uniref:terminase large subunit domain-containing protein n=1 Tax=Sandaracinus amylolyticus TaxID=927083 RepID=UPI001F31D21C|nr:terminase family protein [Sandaracinus amylolyticus]UJR78923.1 Hypothetical protein I5071_9560 [Sandaracinus amylolyticus]